MRWRGAAAPRIAMRTRKAGGSWSRWTPLEAQSEDGPDPGTGEPETRGLSAPAWGLIAWWGFLILSIAFLTWRRAGPGRAILVVFAIHALQNALAAFILLMVE